MALQDVVQQGKQYAPKAEFTDWGLRTYLIQLRAGSVKSISDSASGWNGYADRVAGSTGVSTVVGNAVQGSMSDSAQSGFQPWTGAAATTYNTHAQRVTSYGQALGDSMAGKTPKSLGVVLTTARNALQTALTVTNKIAPATTLEAANQADTKYKQAFQNQNNAAIDQYNQGSYRSFWADVNGYVQQYQNQKADPDLWLHGGNLFKASNANAVSQQDAALLNAWFGVIYQEGRNINRDRTQTVCDQFNSVAKAYVAAYQALPAVPTAPPTKNQGPTTPQYPPAPTVPTNPATPSTPVTPPSTSGSANPTAPTTTAGLTSPTSTAGVGTPTMAGTSAPGSPTPSYPTVSGLNGGATPTFNPDLGHATSAAGLGAPLLGTAGLGAAGLGSVGSSTPKGLGGVGAGGVNVGQPEGGLGAGGALDSALPEAAAMEAAEAANAANGRGGMPMSGAGAGGKGDSKDRTRGVYLPEEEDVWGIRDGVAPPVIGGSW